MIIVPDTNVLISALQFPASHRSPVLAMQRATIIDAIATCPEIEAEIVRVLVEKFRWRRPAPEDRLRCVFKNAIRITLRGTVHLCRDPADDMILECAERAHADLIVTGDKDLLSLATHGRTAIVTPAEYLLL